MTACNANSRLKGLQKPIFRATEKRSILLCEMPDQVPSRGAVVPQPTRGGIPVFRYPSQTGTTRRACLARGKSLLYHDDIAKLSVERWIEIAGLSGPGELDMIDGSPPFYDLSIAGKQRID